MSSFRLSTRSRARLRSLLVLLSLLPSVGAATTASKDAIDRVDDIRARLLATDPTPPQQPGEVPGPVSQWYNFPNWPNWNNWNNWVNWGNWGNWLKF